MISKPPRGAAVKSGATERLGKSPGNWAGENWKGDEQEPHMRRRYYEPQSKARACPSLVKDRGVSLMNGHGVGGVDGARVEFRFQCGTWEPMEQPPPHHVREAACSVGLFANSVAHQGHGSLERTFLWSIHL